MVLNYTVDAWKKLKVIILLNRDIPTAMLTWCDHTKGCFKANPGCSLAIGTDVKYNKV